MRLREGSPHGRRADLREGGSLINTEGPEAKGEARGAGEEETGGG